MGLPPLLDGHSEIKQRMFNPFLSWLRKLAAAAIEQHQEGKWLRTNALLDVCEQGDVEIPGIGKSNSFDETRQEKNSCQALSKRLRSSFTNSDEVVIDHMSISRKVETDSRGEHGEREIKLYKFDRIGTSSLNPCTPDTHGSNEVSSTLIIDE